MGALELIEPVDSEPAPPPRTAVALATPADLLRMAVQSGADLDRLERLMALQERWEANEARKAFVLAMTEFKAEPLEIFKKKHVSFTTRDGDTTSYKHAELSDVADVVVPAMARHGLSHSWNVKQEGGRITVTCTVTHKAGHSESVVMDAAPDASGKKNSIQQMASAVTYLQRYTLLAIVGLATKSEDDDDGAGAGTGNRDTGAAAAHAPGPDPEAILAEWIAKALAAATEIDLNDVVRGGVAAFARDRRSYSRFGEAVARHRAALKAAKPIDPFIAEIDAAEAAGARS